MSVIEVDFPGNISQVADAAALRALPSSFIADNAIYLVSELGLYTYDAGSLGVDNGTSILQPDDLTVLQAGRWILSGSNIFDVGLRTALAAPGGSALVTHTPSGAATATRTVQDKLRDPGPHIDDYTGSVVTRLRAALAAAVAGGYTQVTLGPKTYQLASADLYNDQIFRPAGVALIGAGPNLTTLQITGTSVTNTLFQADNVSNVLTKGMRIIGNSMGDTAAVNAGALMIAALYPNGTPGKTNATGDCADIVFEDCVIENFQSAAWFLINHRGHPSYALRRCGSRRCRWVSRTGNTIWAGRITVPNHFMYFDGILGPVREPVIDDYLMDAYYIKGGVGMIGDVRGAGEKLRIGSILNAGFQNHSDDPTWALSDTQNALDGNPPGSGRGDVAFFFYKHATNPNPPRNMTLEIADVENCVGAHVQSQGGVNLTVHIERSSGMIDTQNTQIPKGVFALNSALNFTGSVDYVTGCKRALDISMDGGNNLPAAANANIKCHFGYIDSMSGVTDVKVDLAGTAYAGGITITGERSGAAQIGVDLRPDATHGLQDIDLSGFKNTGAQFAERWGTTAGSLLRRITSGKNISGTTNAIVGQATSPVTSDLLISDPTVTNDSLPSYPGVQRIGRQSQALTDGATITPDFGGPRAGGGNFHVTLGGNRTLANPTNIYAGQSGSIRVTQDGTGSRTLAYGAAWKFPGGAPTLSTAAGAVDVINYYVHTSSLIEATIAKALA